MRRICVNSSLSIKSGTHHDVLARVLYCGKGSTVKAVVVQLWQEYYILVGVVELVTSK